MKSVLIAHSDSSVAKQIETAIMDRLEKISTVSDGAGAMELITKRNWLLIILEAELPKINGWELLGHVSTEYPGTKVVLISSDSSVRSASRALREGAFDFLPTPIDLDDLAECLNRLLPPELDLQIAGSSKPMGRFDHIIGQSKPIRDVFRLVDKVAQTDSTVMIYGESGTGKELIARAIHQGSRRRNKPLIPVNCGAIPEELLESELFGHEKGAFTSAIRTRIGRFEMADGGTIFLDEIGDMSPKLQVKILRALQEHEIERIGGGKTIKVDIRVITATNKDLTQAVQAGRFREDLYYRLNVIPITVPPLRERKEDVPLLVDHFLARLQENKGTTVKGISAKTLEKICSYAWPETFG
ncbi:MAG: sigma-54-dependent Fis family transcriptional regulator, partial [Deltaproteobacteria bacterium]|nr:sigma-54-dependent Fis family transcriptional regulator [Deltaproteobacteria bacterium]